MQKPVLLVLILSWAIITAAQSKSSTALSVKADTIPHLQSTKLHEVSIAAKIKKLPDIQKVSVYAPDDLKIDGSMAEWDNHFKAFNKITGIFYTISNNDEYIFLTVQAKNQRIINKLMSGGLSFTISSSCITADTNNVSILFPLMPLPVCRNILHTVGKDIKEAPDNVFNITYESNKVSIPKANNDLVENMQYIKVEGIKTITDFVDPYSIINYKQFPLQYHYFKLIAINNQSGIKATTRFDNKRAYNYEMAIPIRYLNGLIDNYQKFGYNITIHGRSEDRRPECYLVNAIYGTKLGYNIDMETPTGFWAEYVMAKDL